MKIVITSSGLDLDSAIDPKFGRCAYLALFDTDSNTFNATANPFQDARGGAGTQTAQWVLNQNATVLLTGHCGPKASAVLNTENIRIVEGITGTVREVLAQLAH
ncbi:NifB/NifX family molybdenum-iron cluster-binding protein [Chromatium okenii]|uniref:NifB/NifX family molybdenum-iron cluster-binding protein n=1 Tax=Chromatium okenii TaxID=61644 RepID=UPI0026F200B1|nr:NifB/NifX family molybdenum-iron cluster-binding protein [Chromatium okenii]MBV5309428.1 NifB/NifX family molybdenum-iron cluster-binding protein [Chromatium okenii]